MPLKLLQYRKIFLIAIILISVAVIIHHIFDFFQIIAIGADKVRHASDFRFYMCGGKNWTAPYTSCPSGELQENGFVYPPPSLIYFHILSLMPGNLAFLLHSFCTVSGLVALSWMVFRMASGSRFTIFAALIASLAIAPIGMSIPAGEINTTVTLFCVAAVYYAGNSRIFLSGLSVAAGFWIKLYPAIVLALFTPRKKWSSIATSVAFTILIGVISLSFARPSLFTQYYLHTLPSLQNNTMPGVAQSIAGMAAHIQYGGGAPIYHFVTISPFLILISRLALIAGIIAALLHQWLVRDRLPLASLSLLLIATLVTTPHAWAYHYALIFPAIFVALSRTFEAPSRWTPILLLCWVALVIPDWTEPPAFIARTEWLNVPVRGRYMIAALVLAVWLFVDAFAYRRTLLSEQGAAPSGNNAGGAGGLVTGSAPR